MTFSPTWITECILTETEWKKQWEVCNHLACIEKLTVQEHKRTRTRTRARTHARFWPRFGTNEKKQRKSNWHSVSENWPILLANIPRANSSRLSVKCSNFDTIECTHARFVTKNTKEHVWNTIWTCESLSVCRERKDPTEKRVICDTQMWIGLKKNTLNWYQLLHNINLTHFATVTLDALAGNGIRTKPFLLSSRLNKSVWHVTPSDKFPLLP